MDTLSFVPLHLFFLLRFVWTGALRTGNKEQQQKKGHCNLATLVITEQTENIDKRLSYISWCILQTKWHYHPGNNNKEKKVQNEDDHLDYFRTKT
jgi:hypothetical protein